MPLYSIEAYLHLRKLYVLYVMLCKSRFLLLLLTNTFSRILFAPFRKNFLLTHLVCFHDCFRSSFWPKHLPMLSTVKQTGKRVESVYSITINQNAIVREREAYRCIWDFKGKEIKAPSRLTVLSLCRQLHSTQRVLFLWSVHSSIDVARETWGPDPLFRLEPVLRFVQNRWVAWRGR